MAESGNVATYMDRCSLQGDSRWWQNRMQLRTDMRRCQKVQRLSRSQGIRACSPHQNPDLCGPCRNTGTQYTGL